MRVDTEIGKWIFDFYSQWEIDCNWYDFTVIKLRFEWDKILGGIEGCFGLMGFEFRVRYNYTVTDEMKRILDIKDQYEASKHD